MKRFIIRRWVTTDHTYFVIFRTVTDKIVRLMPSLQSARDWVADETLKEFTV